LISSLAILGDAEAKWRTNWFEIDLDLSREALSMFRPPMRSDNVRHLILLWAVVNYCSVDLSFT